MTTITSVKNFLTIPLNITELDSLPLSVLLLFCHIAEIKKPTTKSIIIKTINIIKSSVGLPIKLINRLPIAPLAIETMFFSLILITPFFFYLACQCGLRLMFTFYMFLYYFIRTTHQIQGCRPCMTLDVPAFRLFCKIFNSSIYRTITININAVVFIRTPLSYLLEYLHIQQIQLYVYLLLIFLSLYN